MALVVFVVTIVTIPFVLVSRRETALAVAQWWARANLALLKAVVGVELEVRGRENIPQGAALVAVKHQSALETFGIVPCLPDPVFVLKRELTLLPFFGWFLIKLKMIAINRSNGGEALVQMLEQAGAAAAEGRQVVIYPEGTRRAVGDPPRYRHGVAHLYERLGLPCVPVAVDTGLFYPRDTLKRRQGRAVLQFLEPIPAGVGRETFQRLLRERIETATDALIFEAQGGGRAASAPRAGNAVN